MESDMLFVVYIREEVDLNLKCIRLSFDDEKEVAESLCIEL